MIIIDCPINEAWTEFSPGNTCESLVRRSYLLLLDDDVAEEETRRLTDRSQTALEAGAEELLSAAAVDHEDAQTGCDLPDVDEGDQCELAAPAQRQRHAADDAHDVVAASLGAVEAVVGAPPHAVDAVGAVGFRQHVLKGHLGHKKATKLSEIHYETWRKCRRNKDSGGFP